MDNIELEIKQKYRGGRPKGSPNKKSIIRDEVLEFVCECSLRDRLKILSQIAKDNNGKNSDRITAIKLITEILGEKKQPEDNSKNASKYRIELDEHKIKVVSKKDELDKQVINNVLKAEELEVLRDEFLNEPTTEENNITLDFEIEDENKE